MTEAREATGAEWPRVNAALADAFSQDPIMRWMFSHRWRWNARLRRLFGREVAHALVSGGRVLTLDGVPGACIELPPDGWSMTGAIPLSVALSWARVFGMSLPRAIRTQATFEEHHPSERHYAVRYVGVRSERQGQGLGTALLAPTLTRCDAEGLPAYLEASTERSAALYARLGFVHLGEQRLPDGPLFWPMRRPPVT